MELIRCPRCAKEIPDSSRYCRRCGCTVGWNGDCEDDGPSTQGWWPAATGGVFEPAWASGGAGAATAKQTEFEERPARRRVVAADTPRTGGAWVVWVVLGIAGSALVSHVHRLATSKPMIAPRPVFNAPQVMPPPLRTPSGFPEHSIRQDVGRRANWRYTPPAPVQIPSPPVYVRPEPIRPWERQPAGRREPAGIEDRRGARPGAVRDW